MPVTPGEVWGGGVEPPDGCPTVPVPGEAGLDPPDPFPDVVVICPPPPFPPFRLGPWVRSNLLDRADLLACFALAAAERWAMPASASPYTALSTGEMGSIPWS